ncbi:breast cancer metastasis-suppressor 1 isoform X1 [Echinops telfairi]|uniref:Breast cancer metastasis-suppressor 1 isoform X1 n=1 Tax=Echinops telfairi TaxID=9371 RepID=A0AC55DN88_ECHTE|nr:breast cancer metastasis-suppressor 1 isoform X1 [Echinops telfairi]
MPIQPSSKEAAEEMEAEGDSAPELNGEEDESEEERSGSPTESEEESSEMDDEDYERRRSECVSEMLDLEKQFSELKEKLFRERLSQLRLRLEEVGAERAPEYTEPLGGLQQSLKIRIQVAGIYKGFCLDVIRNKYECELQGAKQHLESEKLLLYDALQGELQGRIQRLEEDRQSLDISSEWWDDKLHPRGSATAWDALPPSKRKKAPLVSGPYIVYMLQEIDILEDWTAIKKPQDHDPVAAAQGFLRVHGTLAPHWLLFPAADWWIGRPWCLPSGSQGCSQATLLRHQPQLLCPLRGQCSSGPGAGPPISHSRRPAPVLPDKKTHPTEASCLLPWHPSPHAGSHHGGGGGAQSHNSSWHEVEGNQASRCSQSACQVAGAGIKTLPGTLDMACMSNLLDMGKWAPEECLRP